MKLGTAITITVPLGTAIGLIALEWPVWIACLVGLSIFGRAA
jgi:hypothetical protein